MNPHITRSRQGKVDEFRDLYEEFRQRFPKLCQPSSTRPPATGTIHTSLDLLLWFQEQNPKSIPCDGNTPVETQVLLTQKKHTPYWTWREYQSGATKLNLEPGFFYVPNTLHVESRDPSYWNTPRRLAKLAKLPRNVRRILLESLQRSCIRTNETRSFPEKTNFVFCDLETVADAKRVVPTISERAALLEYCYKQGAFSCGFSPHGLHPVLLFDRHVCVADPDSTHEMERAVQWFFRDFQLGCWKLDEPSWKRSRHERACPLLFWNENAVVKLPTLLPERPTAPEKLIKASGTAKPGREAKRSGATRSGQVTNFLGKVFSGSNAVARATESNICLCRLAGMRLAETAKLTQQTEEHIQATWAEVSLPTLPATHAAAIRAKIFRKGKSLKSEKGSGRRSPSGLPAHWLDAPSSWFNPGAAYVKSSSSFPFRRSEDFFARSFGHSVQAFGDAGYTSEQACEILHFWMALTDSGMGPHEAMVIARDGKNAGAGLTLEIQQRSQRCLNWAVSWNLHRLFADLRHDFPSRAKFFEFLSPEITSLATNYWGKKRKLKPIGALAVEIIEFGVLRHLNDYPSTRAVRSEDIVGKVIWSAIPEKRVWNKPHPLLNGTNVSDLSAPRRSLSARSKMVQRYFKARQYKNRIKARVGAETSTATPPKATKQRGSTFWRIPPRVLKLAQRFQIQNATQPIDVTDAAFSQRHTFTSDDLGGGCYGGEDELNGMDLVKPSDDSVNKPYMPQNQKDISAQGHTLTEGGFSVCDGGVNEVWRQNIPAHITYDSMDAVLPPLVPVALADPVWKLDHSAVIKALGQLNLANWNADSIIEKLEKDLDLLQNPGTDRIQLPDSLPPALQAVRAFLSEDGHVYHSGKWLDMLLNQLGALNGNATSLREELLASGRVLDVAKWVVADEPQLAWRGTVEGEAQAARNVIRHGLAGGSGEIIYGDPGTGKTYQAAERVIAAAGRFEDKFKLCVGSAQHNSALTLKQRIFDLKPACHTRVNTVHTAFDIKVDSEKNSYWRMENAQFFLADEAAQLDAYAFGVMSSRWNPGSEVVLSAGPHQLLPVGPGNVAEDLISCLKRKSIKGWKLTELTRNRRTNNSNSLGIVRFFEAVKKGEKGLAGPGLQLLPYPLTHNWSDLRTSGAAMGACFRKKVLDESESVACFFPLDQNGAEAAAKSFKAALGKPEYSAGEKLRIKEASNNTYSHGLRKGEIVEVIKIVDQDWLNVTFLNERGETVCCDLPKIDLRSCFCLTGHSAQGMEIDKGAVVVLPSRITDRRWLFTAVSRCREECVIVYRAGPGKDELLDCIGRAPERRTLFPKFFDFFAKAYNA